MGPRDFREMGWGSGCHLKHYLRGTPWAPKNQVTGKLLMLCDPQRIPQGVPWWRCKMKMGRLIILNTVDPFSKNSELLNLNNFDQGRLKYVSWRSIILSREPLSSTLIWDVLSLPFWLRSRGPSVRPSACLSSRLPRLSSSVVNVRLWRLCTRGPFGVASVTQQGLGHSMGYRTEFTWKTYKVKFSRGKHVNQSLAFPRRGILGPGHPAGSANSCMFPLEGHAREHT